MKPLALSLLMAGLLAASCIGAVSALSGTNNYDSLADPDNDGLTNVEEFNAGTDPGNPDTDNDGLPDGWEFDFGLNPNDASDAYNDEDYHGGEEYSWFLFVSGPHYTNYDEYYRYLFTRDGVDYFCSTNPTEADSDGDGSLDPDDPRPLMICDCQYGGGRPPREHSNEDLDDDDQGEDEDHNHEDEDDDGSDIDNDGVADLVEYYIGTDPSNPDTDGDQLLDGMEVRLGLDPNDWDTDNDHLADGNEAGLGSTDGHLVDTDSDGIL